MTIFDSLLSGTNSPVNGELVFHSNVHQRYENGIPVRGEQVGCHREVKIGKNDSGAEGYSVTIVNTDAPNSFFAISMETKPMKIIHTSHNRIELRGFGYDRNALMMGIPMADALFECYALTLVISNNSISNCILHMLDRNIDIDYYFK